MSDTPRTDRYLRSSHNTMSMCEMNRQMINADFARDLERELNKAREALRFIAEWGGRTLESEYGDIDCNGKWCAEQAKEAAK